MEFETRRLSKLFKIINSYWKITSLDNFDVYKRKKTVMFIIIIIIKISNGQFIIRQCDKKKNYNIIIDTDGRSFSWTIQTVFGARPLYIYTLQLDAKCPSFMNYEVPCQNPSAVYV